jgi:hypothetical protein
VRSLSGRLLNYTALAEAGWTVETLAKASAPFIAFNARNPHDPKTVTHGSCPRRKKDPSYRCPPLYYGDMEGDLFGGNDMNAINNALATNLDKGFGVDDIWGTGLEELS